MIKQAYEMDPVLLEMQRKNAGKDDNVEAHLQRLIGETTAKRAEMIETLILARIQVTGEDVRDLVLIEETKGNKIRWWFENRKTQAALFINDSPFDHVPDPEPILCPANSSQKSPN